MENKIIELEKKISFQEHTLAELKDVLLDQEKRIKELEGQIRYLKEQGAQESLVRDIEDEEPPPHY